MLPFCKTQTQTISMLSYLFRAGVELDLRTAGKFWGIIIILFFLIATTSRCKFVVRLVLPADREFRKREGNKIQSSPLIQHSTPLHTDTRYG